MRTQSHITRTKPVWLIASLAILAMVLAACQSTAAPTSTQVPAAPPPVATTAPTSTTAPVATPTTAVAEAVINVSADPKLGSILVDGKGMTLYMFTKDEADKSNCDANCLANWPPLLTQGTPVLGAGVDASLVGSAKLADGSLIVTYNHMPLYYWVKDMKAGDTTGQDVGGVWYVVSPDGMKVGPAPTAVPAAAAFEEPTIQIITDPVLGEVLVDGKGMTLYIFTKDGPNKSNCDADCLAKWPPVLTEGNPKLGAGADDSKIGTAKLADGRMIVTYNQRPLYYWVNDMKPGDTTGQGVGGVWYVVDHDGDIVNGMDDSSGSSASTPVAAVVDVTINVYTDTILGPILVDGKGMALYMFTKDEADKSNCDAKCLANWPPLLVQGSPVLGAGIDPALVGTAVLTDGAMIVTYNHMPLYYWVKDMKAGDTTGQDVGGVWYVVNPAGEVIDRPGDVTLNVYNDPVLGPILVDGNGMTLYMYTVDEMDKSNCDADCLVAWPPLLTKGAPILGEGIDPALVGTAMLADGTLIVTYNHMPLYYWFKDTKAGETTGQDVGGVWYVVNPAGEIVGK